MNKEKHNAYMREWNKNHYHKNLDESRARARAFYHKHKERIKEIRRERSKEYRRNNPEKIKTANKEYREAHKDEIKERITIYRKEHKEEIRKSHQEYFRKNPHKRAEYERQRRARKKGCWGNIPSGVWQQILDFYGNECLCCGSKEDLTQDHVIPLSKGGQHSPNNVQPLCGLCNYRKNTKTVDYRDGRIFTG